MIGPDDQNDNLTLSDATQLTAWAASMGLYGVMTWNADVDAGGVDGNAPYAYSLGIENAL